MKISSNFLKSIGWTVGSLTHAVESNDDFLHGLVDDLRFLYQLATKDLKVQGVELGFEEWCLPPGSIVYSNPSPMSIEKVKCGEKVLTHSGDFQEVEKVGSRTFVGDLVVVYPYYSPEFRLTPEHPVLCAQDVRKKQTIWRRNFRVSNFQWVPAEDLTERDFLVFPRILGVEEKIIDMADYGSGVNNERFTRMARSGRWVNRNVKVDEELGELIGWYLAEGSTSSRDLIFWMGKSEAENIERIKELLKKVFGWEARIVEDRTGVRIVCGSQIITNFFFSEFGTGSADKKVPPWVLKLPFSVQAALVKGLTLGDGHVSDYFIMVVSTVSPKLAHSVRQMLFRLGLLNSIKVKRSENLPVGHDGLREIISRNDIYIVVISGDSARKYAEMTGILYDGGEQTSGNFGVVTRSHILIPIRKLTSERYSGLVYNLHVKDDNSYVLPSGAVHNCILKHNLAAYMNDVETFAKRKREGRPTEILKKLIDARGELVRKLVEHYETGEEKRSPVRKRKSAA